MFFERVDWILERVDPDHNYCDRGKRGEGLAGKLTIELRESESICGNPPAYTSRYIFLKPFE